MKKRGLGPVWLAAMALLACSTETENRPTTAERWPETVEQRSVEEPVTFASRDTGALYGLPSGGNVSISDLINVLPSEDVARDAPKFYSSAAQTLTCTNGRTTTVDSLPMTVEGIVTIPGTYYIKVSVCDQEEKFYGSFAIEDDTGGILVLRDSRVAQVQPGDRVRMTVHTLVIADNLGNINSRAILSYDLEKLPEPSPVVFAERTDAFGVSDIGRTRRISGHILDYPTNLNFSTMVIGDQDIPAVDADGSSVCGTYCRPSCSDLCVGSNTSDLCSERICPYLCSLYDAEDRSADADPIAFLEAQMPVCWVVGFNQELMRRGYDFRDAKRLQATGPVLQDYSSLTLTVEKLGQVEVLE